jgi:hypothetical protein
MSSPWSHQQPRHPNNRGGMRNRKPLGIRLILGCGIYLVGLGGYFILVRPSMLPEDGRFVGASLVTLRSSAPGLEGWLQHVFGVMGGYMVASGALTLYTALTWPPAKRWPAVATLAFVGLSTVVAMSAVNFSLDSEFRWLLVVPAVIWIVGVALLATGRELPA